MIEEVEMLRPVGEVRDVAVIARQRREKVDRLSLHRPERGSGDEGTRSGRTLHFAARRTKRIRSIRAEPSTTEKSAFTSIPSIAPFASRVK